MVKWPSAPGASVRPPPTADASTSPSPASQPRSCAGSLPLAKKFSSTFRRMQGATDESSETWGPLTNDDTCRCAITSVPPQIPRKTCPSMSCIGAVYPARCKSTPVCKPRAASGSEGSAWLPLLECSGHPRTPIFFAGSRFGLFSASLVWTLPWPFRQPRKLGMKSAMSSLAGAELVLRA